MTMRTSMMLSTMLVMVLPQVQAAEPRGPVPCDAENPAKAEAVVIKIALDGKGKPIAIPQICTVYPGTEVQWHSDSDVLKLWTRFDTTGDGPSPDDETPDEKGGIAFKSGTTAAGATSIGFIAGSDLGTFPYGLSVDGREFMPNPAIIIRR